MDSKAFQDALKKAKEKSLYTKIISIVKRLDQAEIVMEQCRRKYKVVLAEDIYCICNPSQRVDRKTYSHVIWIYKNLFNLEDTDSQIAQISADSEGLRRILAACLKRTVFATSEVP